MKKLLLMLALVLPCLGAWAQTPVLTYENITAPQELSADDATTIRNMSAMTFVANVQITNTSDAALLFSAVADYTSNSTGNNSIWGLGLGGNQMRYIVGARSGGWYSRGSVSTSATVLVYTYDGSNIKFYVNGTSQGETSSTASLATFSGENAKFYLGGVTYDTNTNWGTFDGTISKVKIYNSVLTDDQISRLSYPEGAVLTTEDFENGKVYTFETSLGWMGAKADGSNAISTAKASNSATVSAEDPYFQWTVYKSDKGNFYIYNVGKDMFLGEQSTTGNESVPMSDTPAKVTFKATTKGGYPLMFKTTDNESCVINHSTNFGEGLITWNGGWSDTNDNGNCHLIKMIDDLDANVLATIKSTIDAYEADNTEAVAELDATITKARTLFEQITIGTGLGEYTATNANYMADFEAIVAFRQAIQATNNPTPEAVEAKTAELETLIASFQLNLPEAGQFLRIKAVANWNDDAPYLGATNSDASSTRAAYIADADANSIFYFDGNYLVSYVSGNYLVSNNNFLGYNGIQATGSKIAFHAASNNLIGAYNISFNDGGRWLYVNQNNYTDAGGRGTVNGYCFNLEEVTSLPVNVSAAGYATFYAPVDLTLPTGLEAFVVTSAENGYAHLEAIDAIPANTGVLLKGNGDYDLAFATESVAEVANNMLAGSIASEYVAKNAYVLSNQAEGVGFYKAQLNFEGNTAFRNKGFKAYLDATAKVQVLKFNFGGNTTAIESVVNGLDDNAPIYDLSGRRVNAATKGIYIQNGKKFIVK